MKARTRAVWRRSGWVSIHTGCANSAIGAEFHDPDWLALHVEPGEDVTVRDVTEQLGILALGGPRSRQILAPLLERSR